MKVSRAGVYICLKSGLQLFTILPKHIPAFFSSWVSAKYYALQTHKSSKYTVRKANFQYSVQGASIAKDGNKFVQRANSYNNWR